MSPQASSSTPIHSERLPDELIRQLHDVNERLHHGREQLESAFAGHDLRHQERVDAAAGELRDAQRQWDEVDRKIRSALHPPA